MDPNNSKALLDELNLAQTTGPAKKPVKKPGDGGVVNATADDLLGELGVDKKKSLSPVLSDGSKEDGSTTGTQQPNYQQVLKSAQDFLAADYNANRSRIDPDLAEKGWGKDIPISKDPGKDNVALPNPSQLDLAGDKVKDMFRAEDLRKNPLPPMDTRFIKTLTDPSNTSVLKDYYKSRVSQIDEDYQAKTKAIEERYPMKTQVVSAGADQINLVRPDQAEYDAEMNAAKTDRDRVKAELTKSVDALADKRIYNEAKKEASADGKRNNDFIDIDKFGKKKLEIMGDPNIEKIKRWQLKGIPVDDGQMFNIDKTGLSVAQSALLQEMNTRATRDENGQITAIPDDLRQGINNLDKLSRGLWEKHSDFRKQQVVRALSDRIYKDNNTFQTTTGLYTITQDDVKRAARELGLDDKLITDIKPGDIKTANAMGSFVNELAMKPAAGLGSFLGRNFRQYVLGQDEDAIDYHYQQLKNDFTSLLADPTEKQAQFGLDYMVDTNKNSPSFLDNIANPKKGKFNWSINAVANTITGGLGQLMSYGYGADLLGEGAMGLKLLKGEEASRNAGLITYSVLTQYDDNYVQAKDMGLNDAKANAFSFIRSMASGFTELIFPDYKVTDALFGPQSPATKMLLKQMEKKGIDGLTKESMKTIFKRALLDGGINTAKETLEEIADQSADVLTTAMFQPDALKQRDIPREMLEVGVQTALSTVLPVTAGAFREHRYQSLLMKNSMYQMGMDSEKYIQAIQEQVDQGTMKADVADKKISVIKTLNNIVKNTPEISPVNGKPLSDQNKVDYANNLLQEKLLRQQLEDVKGDTVQEKATTAKIGALEKERQEILKTATGVEVNIEGKPIMQGDNRTTIDAEKMQEPAKSGSSELTWLKEHYTEKLDSPYRWQQENAKHNLDRIENDPAGFLEDWLNTKDSDSTYQFPPERRAEVEKELAQLKEAQYGKNKEGQQQSGQQGKENAGTETQGNGQGQKNVLNSQEKGDESSPSSSTDENFNLLPPKQREKIKAQQADKSNLPVEDFVKDQLKSGNIRAGYQQMAKDDPKGFMKFVAQQANNVNADGELNTNSDSKANAADSFDQPIIDRANKEFPQYSKIQQNATQKSTPGSKQEAGPKNNQQQHAGTNQQRNEAAQSETKSSNSNQRSQGKQETVGLQVGDQVMGTGGQGGPYLVKAIVDEKGTQYGKEHPGKERLELEYVGPPKPKGQSTTSTIIQPREQIEYGFQKIQPKPGAEHVAANVSYVPLSDVTTNPEKYQPRGTDYSKESVDKIVNNYDDNKLDPIVVHKEANGKSVVLSGHSRLEAHKVLSDLPKVDSRRKAAEQKGFRPGEIKARQFNGNEKEAIEFADRSNDLATKNKDYESAASLRRAREKGETKTSITERAKEDFGKNWRYINNLSYLNPNGKTMTTLKQFENNPDKDTQNKVEKSAQWIGAVRERSNLISDQQENEMFDFLMDKTRSTKLERENDFIQLVQNIIGRFDYNPNEPLNLARLKNKSVQEVSFDQEEAELKNSIKEKEADLDNLNDRLNNPKNPAYVNPNSSDYSQVLQNADKKKVGINAELTALRKSLLTHQQDKGKILSAGINQGGLFDMTNLTPEEKTELNAELKPDGITVDNIQSYEQSLSNNERIQKQSGRINEKTGTVPENVQQSANDKSASQGEDQGGAVNIPSKGANQANTSTGTDIKEEPVYDEKHLDKKDELRQDYQDEYNKSGYFFGQYGGSAQNTYYIKDGEGKVVKEVKFTDPQEGQREVYKWIDDKAGTNIIGKLDAFENYEVKPVRNSVADGLSNYISKYGWSAEDVNGEVVLSNANDKKVATVTKSAGRYVFSDITGTKLMSSPELARGADKLLKEYFYAKEQEPEAKAKEGITATPSTGLDKKVEEATAKKNAALDKFKKKLNESRGTLNVGINPEIVSSGVELMAAYAELGVFKFAQIVRDVATNIGHEFLQNKENVDALKGAYSYYRSNLSKDERRNMDSEDAIDNFIESELPSIIGETQPAVLDKATEKTVSKTAKEIGKELSRVYLSSGLDSNTEISQEALTKVANGTFSVDQALTNINQALIDRGVIEGKNNFPKQNFRVKELLESVQKKTNQSTETEAQALSTKEADRLTDIYRGYNVEDKFNPDELDRDNGDIEKITHTEGSDKYNVHLDNGYTFSATPSQLQSILEASERATDRYDYENVKLPDEDGVIDYDKNFNDALDNLLKTEPGTTDEDEAAKFAMKNLQRLKLANGEGNQIDRQAEENVLQFLQARRFGFTEYNEDRHGWYSAPDWTNEEKLTAPSTKKNSVIPMAEVRLAQGPNGKWTNGVSVHISSAGHSYSASVNGDVFNTRQDAIDDGIAEIDKTLDGYSKNFTAADKADFKKYEQWKAGMQSSNQLPSPQVKWIENVKQGYNQAADKERYIHDQIISLAGNSNKTLRQDILSELTNKRQTIAASGISNIEAELKKQLNDATNSTSDLATDSSRTDVKDAIRKGTISDDGKRDTVETTNDGTEIIGQRNQPQSSPSLFPFDASFRGESGNTEVSGGQREAGITSSPAGSTDSGGGSASNDSGVQSESEPEYDTEGTFADFAGRTLENKLAEQRAAEGTPVVIGDIQNIRATLPVLMKEQQEDVLAAEKRFYGDDATNESKNFGKAIMFTNGTGTGKTLTGLGIAKRFMDRGLKEGLIVVPSGTKASDWAQEAKDFLNINVAELKDTKEAGSGPVVTTYANFRENENLQARKFHWVIYDEAHKINSNQAGSMTSAEDVHKKVTLSPRNARDLAKQKINYEERLRGPDRNGISPDARKALDAELKQEAIKLFKQTKVVFLSATPFAYHKSLTYADGYLFNINEEFEPTYKDYSYNTPNQYDNFFVSNFGYRMKYNKLTQPEAGVDVDLLERQFTEGLKNNGIVVSRKLKIDQDYSRQFIITKDGIGKDIDAGLDVVRDHNEFPNLSKYVDKLWNYIYTARLMESIKARASVDRIQKHLDLGRKIVVFHSFNEGMPIHPFNFNNFEFLDAVPTEDKIGVKNDIANFEEKYPQYAQLDLQGLSNPIATITKAFGDKVLLFNGTVSKKLRKDYKRQFNDDNSGKDIMVVQIDAGKEGLSLHDKTGEHQRAFMNLGLPIKPTDAIQSEGRIYRTGNQTNAVIEYPILNLNFERFAYASKIKDRVRTAENLALGEESRNLEIAFKEGYINAVDEPPSMEQGTGGKQEDARMDKTTDFDKAKTYYYKRQKRTAQQKRNVEGDYYATPEPLGQKMVQWADVTANEKMLEPSSGHGAIARFFPGNTNNTFIEPNTDLRAETSLNTIGETKAGNFEDLNRVNKYDAIIMNPPFGTAGKTAMDHLEKALGHLRENGRVVALVPKGKMDERINDWQESEKSDGFHIRARIDLPASTFERAGTKTATQIVIIDKVTDEDKAKELGNTKYVDLSRADNIKDLFSQIEEMDMPKRLEKGMFAAPVGEKEADTTTSTGIPTSNSVTGQAAPEGISEVVKAFHAKNQKEIFVVKLLKHIDGQEFNGLRDVAKELNGYYSSYKGQGAIPGFVFNSEEDAQKMQSAITGEKVPEGPKMSLADRIRTWKLANRNGALNSYLIPVPAIWNAAVELVARAVEAGGAIADSLRKGMEYIEQNYKEPWQKQNYNREMLSELKAAGKLDYTLAPEQKTQADKIMRKVMKGANIISELNKVREVYDKAIDKMKDPADIQELEDSYKEMEDYMFHNMAVHIADQREAVDLGLEKQTWWQKQKENWRDMYERLNTVQKAITEAGLTIDEKNDMVNRADRWKSIAVAKIQDALHDVGLADIDVFLWKGTKKVNDSMFERMAKEGVDYRKFNLYLYAKHAEERNAHNARVRRQALNEYTMELEGQLASKEADLVLFPTPTGKAAVTRLTNEISLLKQYEEAYSDPNGSKNKANVLANKIPKRFHLMDDGGSGMTNAQAAEILAEVDKEGSTGAFGTFEDEVREKILDKTLDLKRQYGLIDQENYDYLSNYYKNYVPLRVEPSYFEDNLTFSQQKLPGAQIYKSKGANYINFEKRINPLTQAIVDLQATIYEGENNKFKQTIAEAIRTAPDTKVWDLESARYTPVKDKTGKILNLKENKAPDNSIPYTDEGMKKYLIFHDSALYKEMSGANVKSSIPVLSHINQFFRQIFTVYNPAFTATNLFRDLQTAGAVLSSNFGNEIGAQFRNNVKSIFSIIRASYKEQGNIAGNSYWEQRAKEYTEGGGNMAWFRPEVTTDIIKDVEQTYEKYKKTGLFEDGKKLSLGLADFFNRANQAVESSTRLAIYDAVLKSGMPQHKAIEIARNATINFNKKGNFTSPADSLFLFFNATVQGTANLLYSLVTTKRGWKVAGGIALLGFIQSFYNNMMSDCADPAHPENCYDNIPDYEKERNIIIKTPGASGFIKIPLPYGFNIFYNTGEQIGQSMHGKTTLGHATSYLMSTALNGFNPLGGADTPFLQQISPTATDPIVQWYTNRDGLGRPIYNDAQYDRRPDSEKGFASDSKWSKDFAQWLNRQSGGNDRIKGKLDIAPGTLDHIFETATGGTGLFLKQLVGTGEAIIDPREDVNVHDVPVLNRFYTMPAEHSDRGMIYNDLDNSYNTIFSTQEKEAWNAQLQKAVRLGEIKADRAQQYEKTFNKNQYQLTNPSLFDLLKESKKRQLDQEEIDLFNQNLQERVDKEEISEGSFRAYKATMTKNQKQFKQPGGE